MTTSRRFESLGSILNPVPAPATKLNAGAEGGNQPNGQDQGLDQRISERGGAPRSREATPKTWSRQPSRGSGSEGRGGNAAAATQSEQASAKSAGGTRRIAFRMTPKLHAALVAHAAATGSTHGQIVLDSVESAYTQGTLANLLETPGASAGSGLFPRIASRGTAPHTIPVEIRLDARAVAILDQLAADHHATNRTQLITATLTVYLQQPQ